MSVNTLEAVLGNGAIVPLSTNPNDLTLSFDGGAVDVAVDVFGYFQ